MKRIIRHIFVAVMAVLAFTGCEPVLETLPECPVTVKFVYNHNMKFADAFASEVGSVSLFVFDSERKLVIKIEESGERLASDGYSIELPLAPGKYSLLTWCGLEGGSYSIVEDGTELTTKGSEGKLTLDRVVCALNAGSGRSGDSPIESNTDLSPLYHGLRDIEVKESDLRDQRTYEVALTKNTNRVRVMLQHIGGKDVDPDDFEFSIEDCNGKYSHTNTPHSDAHVRYTPWHVSTGKAEVTTKGSEEQTSTVGVAVAEMTTGRLMADGDSRLTIKRKSDGGRVLSIPLTQYALLVKGYACGNIPDQEYLDREDDYALTFFLDNNGGWINSQIIVKDWRIVLQSAGL